MSNRNLARVWLVVAALLIAFVGWYALQSFAARGATAIAPRPVIASRPVPIAATRPPAPPIPAVTAERIEAYAKRILEAQKAFFSVHQQYASDLKQLQFGSPIAGLTIDYRGSSPLGFCWLARTSNGVWYTISQDRVNRSAQSVTAPPPISCR